MSFPLRLLIASLLLTAFASPAFAHPETVNVCTVVVHEDSVSVTLEVPINDLIRRYKLGKSGELISRAALVQAAGQHRAVVLKHLGLVGEDGERLLGEMQGVDDSALPAEGSRFLRSAGPRIAYALRFATAKPTFIDLQQSLGDDEYGVILKLIVKQDGRAGEEKFFLAEQDLQPLRLTWPPTPLEGNAPAVMHPADDETERDLPKPGGEPPAAEAQAGAVPLPAPASPSPPQRSQDDSGFSGYGTFFVHGIWHILVGWDHLLFILGITLAVRGLWELVKVVTAFTVAHTATMTLAALGWVHLPEEIVEPIIAASIVYVAFENAFKPQWAQSWTRLCAAFLFGLFHGLGFAGGLQAGGLSGVQLASALALFALGVEAGHQVVVLPAFSLLWTWRRKGREVHVSRFAYIGSLAIAGAGMYYLAVAVIHAV